MRDPRLSDSNISIEPNILKLDDMPEYFEIEEYDLFDQKEFKQYIKKIKFTVRGSFEYKQLINYLRDVIDMNSCAIYERVNNIETFKIKIEIHHHPFTLEDIILIVYNKRAALGESLDVENVAKEVMFIHYQMMVGLIPLSKTVHEVIHNNCLYIPVSKVFGDVSYFVEKYKEYLPAEQMELYEVNLKAEDDFDYDEFKNLFQVKHIGIMGLEVPNLEDTRQYLRDVREVNMK